MKQVTACVGSFLLLLRFTIVAFLKQVFPKQNTERIKRRKAKERPERVRLVRMELDREDEAPIRMYLR